mmetsp:Transcript_30655/g.70168  ORF Transcript_30655/g.70168 Transcript_30655/m.70168 type:complete len:790 (-) Transcript_30655:193-2562(-)
MKLGPRRSSLPRLSPPPRLVFLLLLAVAATLRPVLSLTPPALRPAMVRRRVCRDRTLSPSFDLAPLRARADDEEDPVVIDLESVTDGLRDVAADVASASGVPQPPPLPAEGGDDQSWEAVRRQWNNFLSLSLPYFKESRQGKLLFGAMVAMTLLNSGVSVMFSYIMRDFWSALSEKDAVHFSEMLVKFGGGIAAAVPVSVLYRYQRELLSMEWRQWMTERTLEIYYSNRVYYALERQQGGGVEIDNPDQRISEDVKSFTAFSLGLFITVVTSIIDLVSFSIILYGIYPKLFIAIVLYAAFGTVGTTIIGKKLVRLNSQKLRKEADFRYGLVRLRENAESIAFYGGEDLEGREVSRRLNAVTANRRDIINTNRNLELFTTAYSYLIQVLPVTVVSPLYFAGSIPLGVVSQSAGAFNHILNDLSVIVNQFESLSAFSAGIDRLASFFDAVQEVNVNGAAQNDAGPLSLPNATRTDHVPAADPDHPRITLDLHSSTRSTRSPHTAPSPALHISGLRLLTPDLSRTLISGLDLSLAVGQNLLIVGNSGAGKSSLLRAVAGLWGDGEGTISRPSDDEVTFLPQRPYCALGTLRDQLLYPSVSSNDNEASAEQGLAGEEGMMGRAHYHVLKNLPSDEELLGYLERVDLIEVAKRAGGGDPRKGLDSRLDWSNTLSLGEQQRLAFGRLLVNRPTLAILDEATSALDMMGEAKMYGLLEELASTRPSRSSSQLTNGQGGKEGGLTYVSVGHRPSLLNYHVYKLRLNGGKKGGHELGLINKDSLALEFGNGSSFVHNL